jgi:endo-1,4-beta-xylanase
MGKERGERSRASRVVFLRLCRAPHGLGELMCAVMSGVRRGGAQADRCARPRSLWPCAAVVAIAGALIQPAPVAHGFPVGPAAPLHPRPLSLERPAGQPPTLGTAVNDRQLARVEGSYARVLLSNFRSVTPEYEMEMSYLEPRPGSFAFARADRIVRFAEDHGLAIRGHALVWDELLPAWVRERRWTRKGLATVLRRYVATVVGHYRGQVGEWDVVNEPLAPDGTLRHSLWERVIGPGYIPIALRAAHRADPHARLFINDYGIGWPGPKERAMRRLLTRLRSNGVPVDGVGVEAHYDIHIHPEPGELREALRDLAATGASVEITELDVTALGPAGLAERLARQARVYAIAGGACRAVGACDAVTTWGITDADSWRGADERALPFDARFRAKPAWRSLLRSLESRNVRAG